jgi:hypothetical protein
MNQVALRIFLILAFIPLMIFIGYGILIIAPIFSAYFAINSYKFNNYKEMYFWIFIGMLCFTVALFALGVL